MKELFIACLHGWLGQTAGSLPLVPLDGDVVCVADAQEPVLFRPLISGGRNRALVEYASGEWTVIWIFPP